MSIELNRRLAKLKGWIKIANVAGTSFFLLFVATESGCRRAVKPFNTGGRRQEGRG